MFNLKDLIEIKKFHKALRRCPPTSIDSFLAKFSHNQRFVNIGKNLIINEIIYAQNHNGKKIRNNNNWYDILSDEISNNLNDYHFVTFNYDLSLEYFFEQSLQFANIYNEPEPDKETNLKLLISRITHVYGSVYDYINIREQYKGWPRPRGSSTYHIAEDLTLPGSGRVNLHINNIKNNIKIIEEERLDDNIHIQAIRERVKSAKKLIILGFGFDDKNINLLGLNNLEEAVNLKEIYYTNFNRDIEIENKAELFFQNYDLVIKKSYKSSYHAMFEDF